MTTTSQDKKETLRLENIEKVIIYLRENLKAPENSIADVRHLWDNRYRVNFWGQKEIKEEVHDKLKRIGTKATIPCMVKSVYVIVDKVKDGFVHTIVR